VPVPAPAPVSVRSASSDVVAPPPGSVVVLVEGAGRLGDRAGVRAAEAPSSGRS